MSQKSNATRRTVDATYRRFGNIASYNGREILYMEDMNVGFEHDLQRAIKVRTWELNLTDALFDEFSVKGHAIGVGREVLNIISATLHGNDREEVILILDHNRRKVMRGYDKVNGRETGLV